MGVNLYWINCRNEFCYNFCNDYIIAYPKHVCCRCLHLILTIKISKWTCKLWHSASLTLSLWHLKLCGVHPQVKWVAVHVRWTMCGWRYAYGGHGPVFLFQVWLNWCPNTERSWFTHVTPRVAMRRQRQQQQRKHNRVRWQKLYNIMHLILFLAASTDPHPFVFQVLLFASLMGCL